MKKTVTCWCLSFVSDLLIYSFNLYKNMLILVNDIAGNFEMSLLKWTAAEHTNILIRTEKLIHLLWLKPAC